MKIIIAPLGCHAFLVEHLMREQQTNHLVGYKFIDPTTFFEGFLPLIDEIKMEDIINVLKPLKLSIFTCYINTPEFINYFVSVTKDLLMYQTDIDTLPDDTLSRAEIKLIIKALSTLNFKEKYYYLIKEKLNTDYSNYFIYNEYYDDYFKNFYDIMLSNNAKVFLPFKKPKETNLYKALNKRQEIEAIAQMIVKNEYNAEDINIICASSDYLPLVNQIFERYKIPCNFTNYKKESFIAKRMIALLKIYQDLNINNLKDALLFNCFNIDISVKHFIEYINILNLSFEDLFNDFTYYQNLDSSTFRHNLKNLQHLENKANNYRTILVEKIYFLQNDLSYEEFINECFNLLNTFNLSDELIKVKRVIEKYYPFNIIMTEFLYNDLNKIKVSYSNNIYKSINITTINNPILPREYVFIMGLDQKSYPAFKSNNGYVDEEYLSYTPFISETDRYNYHMHKLEWIHHNGNTINYSFSLATYEGKSKELSYYIEKLFDKATNFELTQNDPLINNYDFSMNNNDILFNDGFVESTVYKVEQFFKCELAYFLKNILKLSKEDYELNLVPTLGTINHKIFEDLIIQFNKNYASIKKDDLLVAMNNIFSELLLLYPNKSLEINTLININLNNIYNNLLILKNFESTTPYLPTKQEYRFEYQFDNISNFKLKGIIDRIDTLDDKFRIIDYKSSSAKLNLKDIYDGSKLQLISYLNVYAKQNNLDPTGLYYYSLNVSKTEISPYTYLRGQIQPYDDMEINEQISKANKLHGISIEVDNQGDNITNSCKKGVDINQVFDDLEEIYSIFLNKLLSGKFNINPDTSACDYCDYKCICHFNGFRRDKASLIDSKENEDDKE